MQRLVDKDVELARIQARISYAENLRVTDISTNLSVFLGLTTFLGVGWITISATLMSMRVALNQPLILVLTMGFLGPIGALAVFFLVTSRRNARNYNRLMQEAFVSLNLLEVAIIESYRATEGAFHPT